MLLPLACPVCRAPGPAPCDGCRAALLPPPALPPPAGLSSCAALTAYSGVGREMVARFKYRNARSTLSWLAAELAALAPGQGTDVVTWMPTSSQRRRQRGFDQSELLARAVARRLRCPCRPLLRRLPGPAQTGRSRPERLVGPPLELRGKKSVPPRVLLVDDVVTTGGSLTAAARRLRAAGAREVHGLVVARRG